MSTIINNAMKSADVYAFNTLKLCQVFSFVFIYLIIDQLLQLFIHYCQTFLQHDFKHVSWCINHRQCFLVQKPQTKQCYGASGGLKAQRLPRLLWRSFCRRFEQSRLCMSSDLTCFISGLLSSIMPTE